MKSKTFVFLIALSLALLLLVGMVYAAQNDSGNNGSNGGNGSNGNGNGDGNENDTECNGTNLGNNGTGNCNNTLQNMNQNQNRTRANNTFVPWQKRNESDCPEACACHGAVVSCKTETGKIMTITAGNSGNVITIVVDKTEVNTTLELEQEGNNETNTSKFYANKSNGKKSQIKIMPDVAAERALERLRLKVCNESNNCTIVLKDVGRKNETDNKTIIYELQVQRHVRILAIFQAKAQERAEINAENGEVKIHQPWWMFLATKEN